MRDSDYFDQIVLMFSSCSIFVDTGNMKVCSDVVTAVSDANVDILEGILINLSLVGIKLFMGHIIVQGEMFPTWFNDIPFLRFIILFNS